MSSLLHNKLCVPNIVWQEENRSEFYCYAENKEFNKEKEHIII